MNPIENLKSEHDEIILMLDVLERVSEKIASCESVPTDHLKQILNFLKIFAEEFHNGKEETYLFAEIKEAEIPESKDLLAVMTSEHGRGRGFIEDMNDLLESSEEGQPGSLMVFTTPAQQYINLYRSHIWKENVVLFTMAEEKLSADKLSLLGRHFEELEKEKMGPRDRKIFRETLEKLSKMYLGRGC